MCGRIATAVEWEKINEEFNPDKIMAEFSPRFNVAPSQEIPVIVAGSTAFDMFSWGFVPSWAKDTKQAMINARAESITEKPFFKDAFLKFRCLIPVSGFFEWDKNKTPHYIQVKDKSVFALAGIANFYHPKEHPDKVIKTCCIITTEANAHMKKIHERMPVIIKKSDYASWIEPGNTDLEALKELLLPFDGVLSSHTISTLVNSPKNDVPAVLSPAPKQVTL